MKTRSASSRRPKRGLGESHYANGYKPGDFPGNGAYFAREREIADSYAVHFGERVIEMRVPRGVYDQHFAPFEMKYLGSPPGAELEIPSHARPAELFRKDLAPMPRETPRRIRGTVTRHEPFGFFVDFGEESEGVVVITMIAADGSEPNPVFPPVGAVVDAVLLVSRV